MDTKKVQRVKIILIALIVFCMIGLPIYVKNSTYIPDDYIAVFHGGSGEVTYLTYVYKINNGQGNYGFRYINATNSTVSWGSSQWNKEINSRGKVAWTDDVFKVAEKHGAYSFVRLPNDEKTYSIEEFKRIFSLD